MRSKILKYLIFCNFVIVFFVFHNYVSYAWDVSTSQLADSFDLSNQEVGPSGIAFNTDGTKMFIVGNGSDNVNEYTLSVAFDVTTATFVDGFSIGAQENNPQGLTFNTDGTKMFVVGTSGDDVNEYTLSTGFDVSTASFVDSFSVSSEEVSPQDVEFNNDGTEMYVVGTYEDNVNQYTLSTAFDVSTASFTASTSVSAQESTPTDVIFNTDGTKMFVLGSNADNVNEYTLSTAFDVTTATFVDSFNMSYQETIVLGIEFNNDGTRMYVIGTANDAVHQYTLSTGFDVSTAYIKSYLDISAQQRAPTGIAFNNDGTKMFVVGSSGDYVHEYTMSTEYDLTTTSLVDSFNIQEDTVPGDIAFNNDGTKMFIIGATNDNVNEYNLSTGFDVSTASFVDGFSVVNEEGYPTGLAFNADGTKMFVVGSYVDSVIEYGLSTAFDVSTASFTASTSVAAQESIPQGITFNDDGTLMFIIGNTDRVQEYGLSTAFDVTTITFVDNYDISNHSWAPTGLTFSSDGSKMFFVDSGDYITMFDTTPPAPADSTAPTVSAITASATDTTATIAWATDEDSSTRTAYGLTSSYSAYTTELDTSPRVTSHTDNLSNLASCTTYHYAVYSEDALGNGATSTDGTFMTTGCIGGASITAGNTTSIEATGGTASLTTGSAEITLTIPSGFNENRADFQINQLDTGSVTSVTGTEVSGDTKSVVGSHTYSLTAYDDALTSVTSFDQPVAVSIEYQNLEATGLSEESMKIHRWNGSQWQNLTGCSVDTGTRIVTCDTVNFSIFALMGEEPGSITGGIYVPIDLSYIDINSWLLRIVEIEEQIQQLEEQSVVIEKQEENEETVVKKTEEVVEVIDKYEQQKEEDEIAQLREQLKSLLLRLIELLQYQINNSASALSVINGTGGGPVPCAEESRIKSLLMNIIDLLRIQIDNSVSAIVGVVKSASTSVPCAEESENNKGQGQNNNKESQGKGQGKDQGQGQENKRATTTPEQANQGQGQENRSDVANEVSSGGGGGRSYKKIITPTQEVRLSQINSTKVKNKILRSLEKLRQRRDIEWKAYKKQKDLLEEVEGLGIENTVSLFVYKMGVEINRINNLLSKTSDRIERLEAKYPGTDFTALKRDADRSTDQLREAEYLIDLIGKTIEAKKNENNEIPESTLEDIKITLDEARQHLEDLSKTLSSINDLVWEISRQN